MITLIITILTAMKIEKLAKMKVTINANTDINSTVTITMKKYT